MKRTLKQIKEIIQKAAHQKREDAAYGGERGDNGASRLESELEMFIKGYKACADAVIFETNHVVDPETEIDVPTSWEGWFKEEDKEYQEYLRLKEKFE